MKIPVTQHLISNTGRHDCLVLMSVNVSSHSTVPKLSATVDLCTCPGRGTNCMPQWSARVDRLEQLQYLCWRSVIWKWLYGLNGDVHDLEKLFWWKFTVWYRWQTWGLLQCGDRGTSQKLCHCRNTVRLPVVRHNHSESKSYSEIQKIARITCQKISSLLFNYLFVHVFVVHYRTTLGWTCLFAK